jgi:hypothetical protein
MLNTEENVRSDLYGISIKEIIKANGRHKALPHLHFNSVTWK